MTDKLRIHVAGSTGRIELDRPKALNSLDLDMVDGIREALAGWADDDAITGVLVTSTNERAFCAGGDVRGIRSALVDGNTSEALAFFEREYLMNAAIAAFPKPYVSLIRGVAMGGGLGVSVHGSARVVTDGVVMAMPETAIGFIPDIGASHFLQECRGADGEISRSVGVFLGLTGARLNAADSIAVGIGTHYLPGDRHDEFIALAEAEGVREAMRKLTTRNVAEAGETVIAHNLAEIQRVFSAESVEAISERLADERLSEEWAPAARKTLATASPTALVATFELLRAGRGTTLRKALDSELSLGGYLVARCPDFVEGVRAVLVDKDQNPTWDPAAIADVDVEPIRQALADA